MNYDAVFIRGYELYLVLGVHEHERVRRQKIVVSLQAELDFSQAASNDSLKETLNYEELHAKIAELGNTGKYRLLETFSQDIATLVMSHANVDAVVVEIKKENVLSHTQEVGVKVKRSRASRR